MSHRRTPIELHRNGERPELFGAAHGATTKVALLRPGRGEAGSFKSCEPSSRAKLRRDRRRTWQHRRSRKPPWLIADDVCTLRARGLALIWVLSSILASTQGRAVKCLQAPATVVDEQCDVLEDAVALGLSAARRALHTFLGASSPEERGPVGIQRRRAGREAQGVRSQAGSQRHRSPNQAGIAAQRTTLRWAREQSSKGTGTVDIG